jgi:hypothetical protein
LAKLFQNLLMQAKEKEIRGHSLKFEAAVDLFSFSDSRKSSTLSQRSVLKSVLDMGSIARRYSCIPDVSDLASRCSHALTKLLHFLFNFDVAPFCLPGGAIKSLSFFPGVLLLEQARFGVFLIKMTSLDRSLLCISTFLCPGIVTDRVAKNRRLNSDKDRW